jgi:hypothetical protein
LDREERGKEKEWNGKKGEVEGGSKSSRKGRNGQKKVLRGIRESQTNNTHENVKGNFDECGNWD